MSGAVASEHVAQHNFFAFSSVHCPAILTAAQSAKPDANKTSAAKPSVHVESPPTGFGAGAASFVSSSGLSSTGFGAGAESVSLVGSNQKQPRGFSALHTISSYLAHSGGPPQGTSKQPPEAFSASQEVLSYLLGSGPHAM